MWIDQATALLVKHEGLRLCPYKDSLGLATIGVGFFLGRPDARTRLIQVGLNGLTPPIRLTVAQAYQLLDMDVADAIADLRTLLPDFDSLSDVRKCVLVDMRYQLGPHRLRGFTNFLAALKLGHFDTAAAEMLNSTWAHQTPVRAKENSDMLRTDDMNPKKA